MKRFLIVFLLLCSLLFVTTEVSSGGGGYSLTKNGYLWYGKEYIRGIDLPANPNCRCPMCLDLTRSYYAAKAKRDKFNSDGEKAKRRRADYEAQQEAKIENAVTKLIGTPHKDIAKLVNVFQIKKGSDFVLLDPGCGDARILIHAVKEYGCRGIGIEINEDTYKIALAKIKQAGLGHRIKIYHGDSRKYSWEKADGVVMFLFPELISDLTNNFRKLQSGTKVVSYSHDIPLKGTVKCEDIYVWRKK